MSERLCCCVSCGYHLARRWLVADRVGRLFCLDCTVRFMAKGLWAWVQP